MDPEHLEYQVYIVPIAAWMLAVAGFLIGAGFAHIRSMMESGNFAPGNAGPIFFTDFATPFAIFVLLWMTRDGSSGRRV